MQGAMYLWTCPSGQCLTYGHLKQDTINRSACVVTAEALLIFMPIEPNPEFNKNNLTKSVFWLFLALNCFFLLTTTGRVRIMDEVMTYFTTASLAQHGTTEVPQAQRAGLFYGKLDVN